jgi:hypothetical protein
MKESYQQWDAMGCMSVPPVIEEIVKFWVYSKGFLQSTVVSVAPEHTTLWMNEWM